MPSYTASPRCILDAPNARWRYNVVSEMNISQPGGFVCLFRGLPTPLPHSTNARRFSGESATTRSMISLVRCHSCGREAPYGPQEIIEIQDVA